LQHKADFLFFLLLAKLLIVQTAQSQDPEARLLADVPIDLNIMLASYGYSGGNVLLDNTLPIEDLETKLNNIGVAYERSFKMFNPNSAIELCNEALKCNKTDTY